MATKDERREVLRELDDEFREDLAVHLYSSVLLHRIDPHFPRRGWSTWPLPFDETPIPSSSKTYVDLPFESNIFSSDIDADYEEIIAQRHLLKNKHRSKTTARKAGGTTTTKPSRDISGDDSSLLLPRFVDSQPQSPDSTQYSDSDSDTLQDNIASKRSSYAGSGYDDETTCEIYGDSTKPSFASYLEYQSVSNSKVDLLNELHALLERKIRTKATRASTDGSNEFAVSADICSTLTKDLAVQLASRVDTLLNNLAAMPRPSICNTFEPKTWHNVLLASILNSPYQSHNPDRTRHLHQRFKSIFESINYSYEFESDEESDDEANNGDSANTSSIARTAVEHSENGKVTQDDVITSQGFDVGKYLKYLATTTPKQYSKAHDTYFRKRSERKSRNSQLEKLIGEKLDLQSKYESLIWSQKRYKKKYSAHGTTENGIEQIKQRLMWQEPPTLDEQSYLLGHHFEVKPQHKRRRTELVEPSNFPEASNEANDHRTEQ